MRKLSDSIIKEACEELNVEGKLEKKALNFADFSFLPGSILGSITGSIIAGNKVKAENLQRRMEEEDRTALSGNYYNQAQNIVNNLKVVFTPFGVIYIVKDGPKETTIENINTNEMNTAMYSAWQAKDAEYFKNILLNKMQSELQFVEQMFAKKMVEKQLGINNTIKQEKKASIDFNDLTLYETLEYVSKMKDMYSKQNEATEKIASLLINEMDEREDDYVISLKLERPVEKYAFFGEALKFMGLEVGSKDIKSLQGKFLNPSHLNNRVQVGFLPDRVVFIVDNKVMSSLLAMDMNEEGFENFNKSNEGYFRNLFKEEAKKGMLRIQGKIPPNSPLMKMQEKKASFEDNDLSQIFKRNDIHPLIYYKALTKTFGDTWISWDGNALVKAIENSFNLKDGVPSIPLNKILSIEVCNSSYTPYTSKHAFEKIIRGFTEKSVNFMEREISDITPEDLALGIDALDLVTPNDDIYDNFNHEVFSHIIEILLINNCKIFYPSEMTDSVLKDEFYSQLNEYLLNATNKKDIEAIDNKKLESKTISNNTIINKVSLSILNNIRKVKKSSDFDNIKFISDVLNKTSIEDNIKSIIEKQVTNNIFLDEVLVIKTRVLKEQLAFLELN